MEGSSEALGSKSKKEVGSVSSSGAACASRGEEETWRMEGIALGEGTEAEEEQRGRREGVGRLGREDGVLETRRLITSRQDIGVTPAVLRAAPWRAKVSEDHP